MTPSRPALLRYGFALLSIAVATGVRLPLGYALGYRQPYATIFLAVMATAWYGGLGPSLVALLLGGVLGFWMFLPHGSLGAIDASALSSVGLYLLVSGTIVAFAEYHRRGRARLERAMEERGRAECALRESESRFRQLADTIHDVFWITDCKDHAVLYVSPAYETLWGRSVEGLYDDPRQWLRAIHSEDRERVEHAFLTRAVAGGFDEEYRVVRPDGSIRWVRDRGFPIVDATGAVGRLGGIAEDITERHRAEIALRDSEQRFRQLADTLPQIVWTTGMDGKADYLNQRWYETTGFTPQPSLETDDRQTAVHPDDWDRVLAAWEQAHATSQPFEAEYRLRHHASGTYRWHLGRSVPVFDVTGQVYRWYGTATDIHDRKQAEEALQEADRRKNEFLALLAHELRNPLAPIRTSLHLLRQESKGDQVNDPLWAILERQVSRLVRLVDDLMDVARITRGRIELRLEDVDLATVAQHAVEMSRPVIEQRGQTLEVALPDQPITLLADAIRLEQVVVNLLNNSARYTNPGGHIWLTVGREGPSAVVRVRDNGIGIAPDRLKEVFDPFVQLERRVVSAEGGLGLGLSLAKTFVDQHGGSLEARSEGPGQGSEFILRLPLPTPTPIPEPATPPQTPATSAHHDEAVPRHRVLVVDDNEEAADSLGHMLRRLWRQDVRIAYTGTSALELADAFHPEIVLLDLGMPGMDGVDVARALRSRPEFRDTLIVAVTGWGQTEDRRKTREAGFNLHLVKPVEPDVFCQILRRGLPATHA